MAVIASTGRGWPKGSADEQAAYWFALLRSDHVTAAEKRAFELWRAESPAHSRAFERQVLAWETIGATANDADILALRKAALRRSLQGRRTGMRWAAAIAAAASIAIVFFAAWSGLIPGLSSLQHTPAVADGSPQSAPVVLETAIGERSTATLVDGSVVELNTDTQLRAYFTPQQRQVYLLRGQAMFNVAKDADRPFVVLAGDRRITALGTQFDVRVDGNDVAVTLLEGRVAVDAMQIVLEDATRAAGSAVIELRPGEQLVASAQRAPVVREADVERVTSWRTGRLEFEDETLSSVIREINRYSVRKVAVEDPTLSELRISGSFRAGSVENFVTALTELYPIERREGDQHILLVWREGTVASGKAAPDRR